MLTNTAANIIGVESKNEYFAALSLSTFRALATVIVIPDLDVPGNAAAIACDIPIRNDCLKLIYKKNVDLDLLSFEVGCNTDTLIKLFDKKNDNLLIYFRIYNTLVEW